jgi:S-adenosylmethionine hydrolase
VTQKLQGKVVSVSENGDLITSIKASELQTAPRDESVTVSFDGHHTAGIYSVDHDQPEMTLIALIGDADCLEIRLVGESANAFLSVGIGAGVSVEW